MQKVVPDRGSGCSLADSITGADVRKLKSLYPDATVVCVLTGHGLKDPTTAERQVPPFLESDASVGAVAVALGW